MPIRWKPLQFMFYIFSHVQGPVRRDVFSSKPHLTSTCEISNCFLEQSGGLQNVSHLSVTAKSKARDRRKIRVNMGVQMTDH